MLRGPGVPRSHFDGPLTQEPTQREPLGQPQLAHSAAARPVNAISGEIGLGTPPPADVGRRPESAHRAGSLSQSLRGTISRTLLSGVDLLPTYARRQILFIICQHRVGHFRHPRTFSEKVNWRLLYDRRPLLATACDKLAAKDRAQRLGLRAPKTIWQGVDVAELAGLRLPERWVLKPNHGCGLIYLGNGPVRDIEELRSRTRHWAGESAEARKGEWAYTRARRLLLVEEMVGAEATPPADYKVFVFHGEPRLISVERDRFVRHCRRFYTPDWQPLTAQLGVGWRIRPLAEIEPRPPSLPKMLAAARLMAGSFDFVRVDLYSIGEEVFVGELTPYPGGGLARFWPRRLDSELGDLWKLPAPTATQPGEGAPVG